MPVHPEHLRLSYTPEDFTPDLPDEELDGPRIDPDDDVILELDDDEDPDAFED